MYNVKKSGEKNENSKVQNLYEIQRARIATKRELNQLEKIEEDLEQDER